MKKQDTNRPARRPVLEWIVGGLSAAMVVGLMVFLAHEAIFGDTRPPELLATVERMEEVGNGTLVMIAVTNRGDQAAAEVTVEATIADDAGGTVRRALRFDYVAAGSVRRGAFVLEGEGSNRRAVSLSVEGYVEP